MTSPADTGWIKATASNDGGDCVEMRSAEGYVQVRDSKLGTTSPIHTLTRSGFATWLEGAKNGEFDSIA
ncbi:DUF397 domain-containing protein [Kineosporia babensis]|uniref:DUF397 domain-containing protein n=1 Tax=Kineosporia babensis TaxID=499548 RepID=A0A9X1SUY5_9ACTN|nr:DUF397 domain-containing protein [Kineosporia babensis]MCD5312986.1 DUF397 domain-containing protein [Kineosporia babensis]